MPRLAALAFFFRARPKTTLAMLLLLVVTALVEGLSIGFLVPLLESINNQGDVATSSQVSRLVSEMYDLLGIPFALWTIMVGGFALFAVQGVLKFFSQTEMVRLGGSITGNTRTTIFENLLRTDLAYIQDRKSGDFISSLITEPNRLNTAFMLSMQFLTQAIETGVHVGLAIYLSWQLVLGVVAMMGVSSLLVRFEFRRVRRYGERLTAINRALQNTSVEHLAGVRILKAFNLEAISSGEFGRQAREFWVLSHLTTMSSARLALIFQFGMLAVLMLSIYVALNYLNMSAALLLTFIFVLYRLYPRVGGMNSSLHRLTFNLSGVEHVMTLLKETSNPAIHAGTRPFDSLQDGIKFERVTFAYDVDTTVLQDIEFSIRRGETTAIVGGSGAGKTTVVNLLMRFYDPSVGGVLVDGVDLRELDLTDWRHAIALVNQDIFLFNDTIHNNIAVGKRGATVEEIVAAAKRAHAHEFIQDLPDKYGTVIGDRGVRISGGQRQRLALARAVVRDPQILILDEATSELDTKSEQLIRKAVEELGEDRTIVIIAHRLSTIKHADKIIVLDAGRVVESGSHDALVRQNGRYAEFLRVQDLTTVESA